MAYRQANSVPILKEIKTFLDTNVSKVPKGSLTGNAIHYMLNQWDKLTVYCTHASAVCYSLVESAKHNGLEPYQYIHDLLSQLPYAETVEEIEALLPWNIRKNK